MKEKATTGQIIIVFTEHPVFGSLLIPYLAEKGKDETLHLVEQAFHASEDTLALMNESEREAIRIASHYTEKYLMSIYSKEKAVSHFLHKLSDDPEKVKNKIRPFIEKKLLEMLSLIRDNDDLKLYQKQAGSKILYAHHAYHINRQNVEIRFTFNVDTKTFNYQLQCFYEGRSLSLSEQKPVIVLTTSPANLLLGMELYSFPHIESNRLVPFTKKKSISVDVSLIDKYIDNILIPIARYHRVITNGLKISEEKRSCEAILTLEDTIYEDSLLRLHFQYADQSFNPDGTADMNTILYRDAIGDIFYFRRDSRHEEKAVQLLIESGLQQISDVHFRLSPQAPEKTITEWISTHREMLQQLFLLTGGSESAPYCLDEIHIEQSYEDGPDWFELHITVVIGNFRIPFSRFRKHILEEKREYELPDGRLLLLPEEWFNKYGNLLEMGVSTEKGIQLKHTYIGAIQSALNDTELRKLTSTKNQIEEIAVPRGLKAQLRPYQQKGFLWMVHLNKENFNGCLADDMGLGKTLQTLTLLQHIYQPQEKIEHSTAPYYLEKQPEVDEKGQYSLFSFSTEEELLPIPQDIRQESAPPVCEERPPRKASTLIIVPTSLLHNWRREAKRFTTLSMFEYHSNIIIPKGHPERFFSRFHLIITSYGTMRNNIDILSQYCFEYIVLDESQNIKNSDSLTFRTAIQLQSNHRLVLTGTPIENSLKDLWAQFRFLQPDLLGDETNFQKQFINPIRLGNIRMEVRLQQLISPFILRRSKSEVAPELPSLTEETIFCEMSEEQHLHYEQEKNSIRNMLLQQPNLSDNRHAFSILNGILRLRQLASHPQLVFPDYEETSGKMAQIIEIFDTLRSEGHKVLIFSSFVKHLELLAEAFRERGWKYALLTGSTANRPSEITQFIEQKDVQAFFISLKAGGVGLNLTEADYVFIIDPWWNPAAEAQAIARAHRIGQDKQVIAYRFITQNSIEEKILLLQEEKRKLAEIFITDNDILPHLSEQEWANLLQ